MKRPAARREAGEIALIAEILRELPNLAGATCVGSAELFDAKGRDEEHESVRYRHTAAAELCRVCPARAACTAWAATQPDQQTSVIAGQVPALPGTVGRPRKDAA